MIDDLPADVLHAIDWPAVHAALDAHGHAEVPACWGRKPDANWLRSTHDANTSAAGS
jgi:hypothetical protein